jgi:hypothetical protein
MSSKNSADKTLWFLYLAGIQARLKDYNKNKAELMGKGIYFQQVGGGLLQGREAWVRFEGWNGLLKKF